MKVKEAVKIVKKAYPDMVIVECLEFDDFFAFALADHELADDEMSGGGYETVDKKTGSLSTFNPTTDMEAFMNAQTIELNSI